MVLHWALLCSLNIMPVTSVETIDEPYRNGTTYARPSTARKLVKNQRAYTKHKTTERVHPDPLQIFSQLAWSRIVDITF